jgi:hypothetical protein
VSIPFSWFWPTMTEVTAIVVLIGWVSRRLGFAPIVATGWKHLALKVVGILCALFMVWSVAGWISCRSVPSHDTIACSAGYLLGAALDDLIAKCTGSHV